MREAMLAERARIKAEKAEKAALPPPPEPEPEPAPKAKPVLSEEERKALRDAKYAARKARRK